MARLGRPAEDQVGFMPRDMIHAIPTRMTTLIDHLPVPIVFIGAHGNGVFVNPPARTLLGLPAEENRSAAVASALARLDNGDGAVARRARLTTDPTISLMFEIGAGIKRRYQVETRWIDQEDLTGRIWLFRDITSERAFQAKLTDIAGLLELTVENVNEGVLLIDEYGRVSLWNHGFVECFDFPDHLVEHGTDYLNLMRFLAERGDFGPGSPEAKVAEIAASFHAGTAMDREVTRSDGRILFTRRNAIEGGRFLVTVRDVTEERLAARFREELIATVSHELRTPLTAIAGSLALLKAGLAGAVSEQAAGLIEVAHRNADRLTLLINDLLDMDKLSDGKLEFHFAETDLRQLIAEIAERNTPYAQTFGVAIELDLPDDIVMAEVDADRLGQVMNNLLSNASKFSPRGSVITVRLAVQADSVRIAVIDRGRGMSPEFRRRLFTLFAQEDRSAEGGQAGTGLGLAISKSIVDEHRGTIAVDTELGRGTTFEIDLPRRRR